MLTLVYVALLSALGASALPSFMGNSLFDNLGVAPVKAVTMPFVARMANQTSTRLIDVDRARIQALRSHAETPGASFAQDRQMFNVPVRDSNAVSYVVSVEIGTPPTTYALIVDTGSSNTWIGALQPAKYTSSTRLTGNLVNVNYGSGSFYGVEVIDTITIGINKDLSISNQSLGFAIGSQGFDGVDGILGVGPVDLTKGTLHPDVTATIPTVTDNLWDQGIISNYEIGIFFEPTRSANGINGELSIGGANPAKMTGGLQYTPLTQTKPASMFVGIDQKVNYNGKTLLTGSGIVDTGTTLLLFCNESFNAYLEATGGTFDSDIGLIKFTQQQYDDLKSLEFHIGNLTLSFNSNAQIWPRHLNTDIGGDGDGIYGIVSSTGEACGQGLDFINGMSWLERYYFVYDIGNSRAGFATTTHTDDKVN